MNMKRKTLWISSLVVIALYFLMQAGCSKSSSSSTSSANPNAGPDVTDVDGNVYHSITIGTQVWMASNLKVTHNRNGVAIPNVTDSTQWSNDTTAAYCSYNNDAQMTVTYGRLYNWYAVANANNLAPTGWHVASDSEWTVLTTFLGTSPGGKLKETGLTHWTSPNTGATNSSGFTALPGADRSYIGQFHNLGIYGLFWTSSQSGGNGIDRILDNTSANVYSINYPKGNAFAVRCVKN